MDQEINLGDIGSDLPDEVGGVDTGSSSTRYNVGMPRAARETRYGYRPASPAAIVQPGDTPEDAAFWAGLKDAPAQESKAPPTVIADPEKIKRARALAATLNIPFAAAYDGEPQLSAEMEKHDPTWMKEAGKSVMRGLGNMYVTSGRALELAGAKDFAQTYVGFGRYLNDAYAPSYKPSEFSWRSVFNPEWWATTATEGITSSLSLMPAAIVGGYAAGAGAAALGIGAFGSSVIGALGGSAAGTLLEAAQEAGGHYDQRLQQGIAPDQAEAEAQKVFIHNIELLSGTNSAEFLVAFTPLGRIPGAKTMVGRIAASVGRFAGVGLMEGAEEGIQQAFQDWAAGKTPEWTSPEYTEQMALGFVMGVGINGAGSVHEALTSRIESKMQAKLKDQFYETKQAGLAMGLDETAATTRALDKIAETPEGKSHIEAVVKELVDIAEGKPAAPVTVEEKAKAIDEAGKVELSDQEFESIAKGESSIDDILGKLAAFNESLGQKGEVVLRQGEDQTRSDVSTMERSVNGKIFREVPKGDTGVVLSDKPAPDFGAPVMAFRRNDGAVVYDSTNTTHAVAMENLSNKGLLDDAGPMAIKESGFLVDGKFTTDRGEAARAADKVRAEGVDAQFGAQSKLREKAAALAKAMIEAHAPGMSHAEANDATSAEFEKYFKKNEGKRVVSGDDYRAAQSRLREKMGGLVDLNKKIGERGSVTIREGSDLMAEVVGMDRGAFDKTAEQIGSNIKERWTRVVYAEDENRLPNLKNHFPENRQTPIIKNPPAEVTIYRAAPGDAAGLRPGDWVALDRSYASRHKSGRQNAKIISERVSARDVVWAGTDENEFFYAPKELANPKAPSTFDGIISSEAYKAAQARLKEKTGGLKVGFDPSALVDMAIIGAYHLESGVRTFAEWSARMVKELGDAIKPYLKAAFETAKAFNERLGQAGQFELTPELKKQAEAADKQAEANREERLKKLGRAPQKEVQSHILDHIKMLSESPVELTFKGKTYDKAVPEGVNGVKLSGPDGERIVKGLSVMEIDESIPFDIPGEDISQRVLKNQKEADQRRAAINKIFEQAGQPAGAVKGQVRSATGQVRTEKQIKESEALRAGLKKAEQAARIAYKVGTRDALERAKADLNEQLAKARKQAEGFGFREGFKLGEKMTRKELITAFKDSSVSAEETRKGLMSVIQEELPPELRGKFLQAVAGEITKQKQESILRRVADLKDVMTRKELLDEIKDLSSFKGNIAIDYQRQINDAIKEIDLDPMSMKTRRKLEALKDFAERRGMPSGIRPEVLRQLERLEKLPAEKMLTENLQALKDQLEHLREMGKMKLEFKNKYDQRQREYALGQLLKSTQNSDPKSDIAKSALKAYLINLQSVRAAEIFDGMKSGGKNRELVTQLRQAEADYDHQFNSRKAAAADEIAALKMAPLDDAANLRIMLNIRQQEGAEAQVKTLLEKNGLTEVPALRPGEQELIDILKKYSNADTQRLAAVFEETTNEPFPVLENRILPLKYEGEARVDEQTAILQRYSRKTQTEKGFTVARQSGVKRMPRIDLMKIFEEGLREQLWYMNMQPALDNVARLVKTKEYVNAAGEVASNWWKDQLDMVARGGGSASAAHLPGIDAALRAARGNLQQAVLGWKMSSILAQPFAVFDAMSYAGSQLGPAAAARVLAETAKAWIVPRYAKDYIEQSQILKQRATGELSVREVGERFSTSSSIYAKFVKSGMELLSKADVRTAAGVQKAFEKIMLDGGMSETRARQEAETLMEVVSSSSAVSFRPQILSKGEWAKTIFTFQSFVMNRWGMIAHDMIGKGIKGDYKAKLGGIFGLSMIVAGMMAEDVARQYIFQLTRGTNPPDRPAWMDALFALPENIPYLGSMFNIYGKGKMRGAPLGATLEDIFAPAISPDNPRKWIRSARGVAALTFGVPGTYQAAELIERALIDPDQKGSGTAHAVHKPTIKKR